MLSRGRIREALVNPRLTHPYLSFGGLEASEP